MQLLAFEWGQIPFVFIVLLIAFTFHEFAHAYTAYKFGDPTPYTQGRVSLNPRVHLDLLGTILIFLVGFGWAKPVFINRHYFKHPRLMGVIVSAAGPVTNLLIAFAGLFVLYVLVSLGWISSLSPGAFQAVEMFFNLLVSLNILLFVFNLLPVPPLDGYRIISDLLPVDWRVRITHYEKYGVLFFLLVALIPPLRQLTIDPAFSLIGKIANGMHLILQVFFGNLTI